MEGIFKQDLYTLKSEIAGAEAAIQKAEDRLERTQRARQRMSEVAKDAAKTPADIVAELDIVDRLEDAEQSVQKERKTLELARAKLDVLEKYTREKTTKALKVEAERKRTEELGKKEAWVLEKNKVEKLKKQIEACRIFAPRDGVVVYANDPGRRGSNGRPQVEEGATVRERQKIASVLDLAGPMQVNLKVPESKVDFVSRRGCEPRSPWTRFRSRPCPAQSPPWLRCPTPTQWQAGIPRSTPPRFGSMRDCRPFVRE